MELVSRQLLDRFNTRSSQAGVQLPFLMGQGVWLDSDKLGPQ